jgi:hypothetical protein
MFDLEEQIRQWRRAQGEALGGRPEVVDELESHLRDEVQRLVQSGHPAEGAWALALERLGQPGALAAEFDRTTPGLLGWRPGLIAVLVLGALTALLGWRVLAGVVAGRMGALLASHVFLITIGYTTSFAIGVLATWGILRRLGGGWDGVQAAGFRATARWLAAAGLVLTAGGVVLGGWWAADNMGRFWGWDLKESGGLSVLVWNSFLQLCLWLLRRRQADLALGMVGPVVVSLAWFGPGLVAGQDPHRLLWLIVFLAPLVLLLVAALVPLRARAQEARG